VVENVREVKGGLGQSPQVWIQRAALQTSGSQAMLVTKEKRISGGKIPNEPSHRVTILNGDVAI